MGWRCWGRKRSQQDREPAPAGVSPKTLPGLPLPEAGAVVSLLEVNPSVPWLPGRGKSWHRPFGGCFVSAGEEQRWLSFPEDAGREHTQLLLRANPHGVSFQKDLLWGLQVSGPVAPAAALQDAPQWRTLLCLSSSFSLTASALCSRELQTAKRRSFCWCESL